MWGAALKLEISQQLYVTVFSITKLIFVYARERLLVNGNLNVYHRSLLVHYTQLTRLCEHIRGNF